MLTWALLFFIVSIVSGVLGFYAIAGTAALIAKILFFVFLIAFLIAIVRGRTRPIA
tara:strand:- start:808 stop:975 length:168 start_codon:yes stop_codon:yes gene_type:complete